VLDPDLLRVDAMRGLLLLAMSVAAAGCGGGGDSDGLACGAETCAAGMVCCLDCDGTGTCLAPGGVCPGTSCEPEVDAASGIVCGATTCAVGQACCVDCDGTGSCINPGEVCTGVACLPDAGADCPDGTCVVNVPGICEEPTGPVGNGCCACGEDGLCSNFCRCAAPDTPIATPLGERPIAELAVGDLVYSWHRGRMAVVPIRAVNREPVWNHRVVRVTLATGTRLEISGPHPTADGRVFADLAAGDQLGGFAIMAAELVPYGHSHTYDILPDSDTGTYVAGGALIGSTLAGPQTR
jgi:hypothetical protein